MNYSEEIIENYIRGELSGPELHAFENSLAADPKLLQEVNFQRDIINSIQSFRHQQLKSRLNNIEINTGNGLISSVYIKFAASIVVVASLIGGTVFWLNSTQTESQKTGKANTLASSNSTVSATEKEALSSSKANQQTEVSQSSVNQAVSSNTTAKSKSVTSAKNQSEVQSGTVTDESVPSIDHTDTGMNTNFEMPDATIGAGNVSAQNIKVNIVKENTLGYRFFNNQLFLHGNFSNSTYELYELNSSPKKQVFLYFENNYYELTQGKTKVTPLVVIKDKATLEQLNILRSR